MAQRHSEATKRKMAASAANRLPSHYGVHRGKHASGCSHCAWIREHATEIAAKTPHRSGYKLSAEHKAKLSASWNRSPGRLAKMAESLANHSQDCVCGAHKIQRQGTGIERVLLGTLLAEFPDVVPQQRFGRWTVDAYIPSLHIAFEADGEYWHSGEFAANDARRDALLYERYGLPIVRLSESELKAMV